VFWMSKGHLNRRLIIESTAKPFAWPEVVPMHGIRSTKWGWLLLVAGSWLLLETADRSVLSAQSSAATPYTIVDLGDFQPLAINNLGQITGVRPYGQDYLALVVDGANVTTLDLGGLTFANTTAISDSTAVSGYGWLNQATGNESRAFIWKNGFTAILPPLPGDIASRGLAVNKADQVAGISCGSGCHAVVWTNGVPVDLGTLGGAHSDANGINDGGDVVGQADVAGDATYHAFVYHNGTMTDLGTLGGSWSTAYAIRNDGLVLGFSAIAGDAGFGHPFMWQNGVMTDLGSLGGPDDYAELVNTVNNHGESVGEGEIPNGDFHAIRYKDGALADLNDFLPADSGWVLTFAQGVNDQGEIVGAGTVNGEFHGYLLMPTGSTSTGGHVSVSTSVATPGGNPTNVTTTFDGVTQGGETTVTASSTGPVLPAGFQLPEPPVYFDVTTTATFTGGVTLCFSWTEGALQNEANARLLHYEGGGWADVTTSVNTTTNTVCGRVTSLSPFVIAQLGYEFVGFDPPLLTDGSASIQQSKAGKTIPVKFQLRVGGQLTGAATATIAVYRILDIATGTVDTTSFATDSGASTENTNQFRYDTASQQYIYNLQTKNWRAPATYQIVVTVSDGSSHNVNVSLR
jgi:probable HAF family extracellular repeat protein